MHHILSKKIFQWSIIKVIIKHMHTASCFSNSYLVMCPARPKAVSRAKPSLFGRAKPGALEQALEHTRKEAAALEEQWKAGT
jgi:hypothetical protein